MSRELQTINQQNKLALWAGRIQELFGSGGNRHISRFSPVLNTRKAKGAKLMDFSASAR